MIDNVLLNDIFLNELFQQSEREIYARITALTWQEQAIESIEGRVSGGSVNVDGASVIRRSCSLTLVANDLNINEFYWGIRHKFKLEIGLSNDIEPNYENVIWFPQGIFLISNFDVNFSLKKYQISIKGKDKMCLLNGDLGGHFPHEIDLGVETYHDLVTDTRTDTEIQVKHIIREMIRNYADELPHNIIINDIEDSGLELLEYRGTTPIYMFRESTSDIFTNITFNEKQECYYLNEFYQLCKTTIDDEEHIIYDNLVDLQGAIKPTKVILSMSAIGQITQEEFLNGTYYKIFKEYYTDHTGNIFLVNTENDYYISGNSIFIYASEYDPNEFYYKAANEFYLAKFEQGSTPGYKLTDLTYAGDLIMQEGATITSALDKIKTMLGQFEYFYNLDGQFVFQKTKNYNAYNWSGSESDKILYNDAILNMEVPIFNLLNNKLLTSFKNMPKIENMKNDYSVWGSRKLDSGQEQPIHARYAIDIKPKYYKTFDGKEYFSDEALYDKIKYNIKNEAIEAIKQKIESFVPQYSVPDILDKPQRMDNGDWSPGWWDIRDWAAYYKLLMATEEDPMYTMKWYSQGDSSGYQAVTTKWYNASTPTTKYVWLIIDSQKNGFNYQHGGCDYSALGTKRLCTKYAFNWEKYYAGYSSDTAVTRLDEQKYFSYPYAGCSDPHTYLSFLKYDIEKNGNKVYFYNPAFIDVNYEDLVDDLVKEEYEERIKNSFFVDWREIIYQMAVDYRRHYHEDDFLYNVAQNNFEYYPTGITGYERYYTDLISFWRDLYNPNPDPISENVSYLKAFNCWVNDTLYISNSYRKLFEEEKDEYIIDINNLYVLDYSYEVDDDKLPETPEIIPFLGSQYCHLNYNNDKTASDDVYFYVEGLDGQMNDGVDDIQKLNAVNLSDIYIKERGPFITHEGYEDTFKEMSDKLLYGVYEKASVGEREYKVNGTYFVKTSGDDYVPARGAFNQLTEYYIVNTGSDRENNPYIKVKVSQYLYEKGKFYKKKDSNDPTINISIYEIVNDEQYNENIEYYRFRDLTYEEALQIREDYYQNSKGFEVLKYYYVGGYVKPGDEWPGWNNDGEYEDPGTNLPPTPEGELPDNILYTSSGLPVMTEDKKWFIIRKNPYTAKLKSLIYKGNEDYEAYAKYQYWVFKYPFGTKLGQYPDDYTNYAEQAFQKYLNEYGWDNLYIKDSSPIKFSELDTVIQRLYYKHAGVLAEYLNLLQYNNFNELKTNYTEISNNIPAVLPTGYSSVDSYIAILKELTLEYVGVFPRTADEKLTAIYKVDKNLFKTEKEYNQKIQNMYIDYINWLASSYSVKINEPYYRTEWAFYQNIYYNFNNDSLSGDYWTKMITESPELLDFWFDFINGETSYLSKYSVQAIGPRTKVINDTTVKAISYKEVPNTIFITSKEEKDAYEHKTGYTYIQLPQEMSNIFVTSARGKSAKSAIEDLIYQHCYATEEVNINTIPIYHLQPNSCLYIKNDATNINGDYIISKISIPLEAKKTMSITATKVIPSII